MRCSGAGRPSALRIGRLSHGPGSTRGRPGALVEPAQDHEVRRLQARLQRAPEEEPRVAAPARPHRAAGEQRVEEGRRSRPPRSAQEVAASVRSSASARAGSPRRRRRAQRRCAPLALSLAASASAAATCACSRSASGAAPAVGEARRKGCSACQHAREPGPQAPQRLALPVARGLARGAARVSTSPSGPAAGRGPRNSRRSSARASRRKAAGRQAAGGQRMLQQRQPAVPAPDPPRGAGEQRQQNQRRRRGQRLPAESSTARPQRPSSAAHAARQLAVGRHQRRGAAGPSQRPAQRHRDDVGLSARMRAVEPGETGQRRAPTRRAAHRRPPRPAARQRIGQSGGRKRGCGQLARVAGAGDPGQRCTAWRRRCRARASSRTRPYCGCSGRRRRSPAATSPRCSVSSRPGSTTRPCGRRATTARRSRHGRDRAGRAGGHDRPRRLPLPERRPARRAGSRCAVRRVDRASARPGSRARCGAGCRGRRRCPASARRSARAPASRAGAATPRCVASSSSRRARSSASARTAAAADCSAQRVRSSQARTRWLEQEAAPHLADGRPQIEREARRRARLLGLEGELVRRQVAQRHEARQHGRLAAALAQEGLAQRARRAAVRQQQGDVGQAQPIVRGFGQQAGGQSSRRTGRRRQ